MSEILSIEQLKQMATSVIEIPGFSGTEKIKVRVQKVRLMEMAKQGKIPNHLLSVANSMTFGKKQKDKELGIKDVAEMMELYCRACLVEPTYDEFKDIMTDEQGDAIFEWAMGRVQALDSFRADKENGSDNSDGEKVSEKAE